MPNGLTHSVAGGLSGLAVAALDKDECGNSCHNSLPAIGIRAVFGKLPDVLELSLKNPHHRQFYHNVVMLALVGYGTKKACDWETRNMAESIIRGITLCAGVGYLTHLLLDATTSRSLPLLGKI